MENRSTKLNSSEKKNSQIKVDLNLLPLSFKNEMFDNNLSYFRRNQQAIFNKVVNYQPVRFRLCTNPDGSPNILDMEANTPLFFKLTMDDLISSIRKNIENITCSANIGKIFFLESTDKWRLNNPIQYSMNKQLYEIGTLQNLNLKSTDLSSLKNVSSDFFPLMRMCGICLGYQITELIKAKRISFLTIYEPHFDLFYTSLFTIPWEIVFRYFSQKGKSLNLTLGGTPQEAIQKNNEFLRNHLLPLNTFFYQYNHLHSKEIKEFLALQPNADQVERSMITSGWYEDQRFGLYYSSRNLRNGNKVYTGNKVKKYFRAFIVGAGPSLNDTISLIKKNQKEAIIISCGTALSPLIKAGIIPDFQVVQERVWHFEKYEETYPEEILKHIYLFKLNVVSPKIDNFYKDTFVFQKYRDPGSALLNNRYAVTTAVNPTVTNAGIAIAAELGANEVYLFGVDYGAPADSDRLHAKNTRYDDENIDDSLEKRTRFEIPGNLGAVIKTSEVFSWSLRTSELKIAEFPKVKWFNVGEGAYIKKTIPVHPDKFPKNFILKVNKKQLKNEITSCFNNNYSFEEIHSQINGTHRQQISDYFEAISYFKNSTPYTKEEILLVLSNMYKAVIFGQNQTGFLPASLLPPGFMQFITNVFCQISLAVDDATARKFFKKSLLVLMNYIEQIDNDILRILQYIDLEEEIDLIETW